MLSQSNSPTDSHYDNSLNINGHNYLHSYLDKPGLSDDARAAALAVDVASAPAQPVRFANWSKRTPPTATSTRKCLDS